MAHLKLDTRTGQWAQTYNFTFCGWCFGPLTVPHARPVPHPCQPHRGHWELICKICGHSNWDTWCDQISRQHPLVGHDHRDSPTAG